MLLNNDIHKFNYTQQKNSLQQDSSCNIITKSDTSDFSDSYMCISGNHIYESTKFVSDSNSCIRILVSLPYYLYINRDRDHSVPTHHHYQINESSNYSNSEPCY